MGGFRTSIRAKQVLFEHFIELGCVIFCHLSRADVDKIIIVLISPTGDLGTVNYDELIVHQTFALVADDWYPGIQDLLDFQIVHVIAFHDHAHHHPTFLSMDEGITDTP